MSFDMLRLFVVLTLLLTSLESVAQDYPFYVKVVNGVVQQTGIQNREIVAYNDGPAPITVLINTYVPINVKFSPVITGNGYALLIPPKSKQVLTTATNIKKNVPSTFRYGYKYFFGDPSAVQSQKISYKLPFPSGYLMSASQYSGAYTNNKLANIDLTNAIQFYLPKKTPVLAARTGIVLDVKGAIDGSDQGKSSEIGNYILVMHDDGTIAQYSNLQNTSVLVQPLQVITTGEHIADSADSADKKGTYFLFAVLKNAGGNKAKSLPFMIQTKDDIVLSSRISGFVSTETTDNQDPYAQKLDASYANHTDPKNTLEDIESTAKNAVNTITKTHEEIIHADEDKKSVVNKVTTFIYYLLVLVSVFFILSNLGKIFSSKSLTNKKSKLRLSFIAKYQPIDMFADNNLIVLSKRIKALLPATSDLSINVSFSAFLVPVTANMNFLSNPISSLYAQILIYTNNTSIPIAVIDVDPSVASRLSQLIFSRKKSVLESAGLPYIQIKNAIDDNMLINLIREVHIETLSKAQSNTKSK